MKTQNHQDIKPKASIIEILPEKAKPYGILARLDRPIGIWLLLIPGLWALVLASPAGMVPVSHIVLFTIGAVVMRAAGCVINDLWDRELDQAVERTRTRPIASGDISAKQGLAFLSALLICGLIILMQFNLTTIILGVLSLPLIIAYPLMKRITWWPQAFLGITFNFGALMGWTAITGHLSWQPFALYASGILWTLAYDTIYAHQDKEDDALIGIKSTARLFAENSPLYIYSFYGASWLISTLASGSYIGAALMLPAGVFAVWMLKRWQPDNHASSLLTFKQSKIYGLLILLGFILGQM